MLVNRTSQNTRYIAWKGLNGQNIAIFPNVDNESLDIEKIELEKYFKCEIKFFVKPGYDNIKDEDLETS